MTSLLLAVLSLVGVVSASLATIIAGYMLLSILIGDR